MTVRPALRVKPSAFRLPVLAAALGALALSAASAAEMHRARCHQDMCEWFSIESKELVASDARATVFKVTTKNWTSEHPNAAYNKKAPRVGGDAFTGYFKCSKSKPAYVESQDGKWTATFLDVRNPPGFAESVVMQYFVVCHGFDTDKSKSDFDVVGRKFGYRKISQAPAAIALSKPEEILTR